MAVGMARRKVLVCPVITPARVSVSIPRDAIVISVVLRHMQIYLAIVYLIQNTTGTQQINKYIISIEHLRYDECLPSFEIALLKTCVIVIA